MAETDLAMDTVHHIRTPVQNVESSDERVQVCLVKKRVVLLHLGL